jgi:phage portal protein BeeE
MAGGFLKRLGISRRRQEPKRDTTPWPNIVSIGQMRPQQRVVWKPTPRNLRYFSHTVYARRAINAIKNPIAMLDWEIVPVAGAKESPELKRQIETATYCLQHPNRDDSWRTMIEQVVEDTLIGAGAVETQRSGNKLRPLWLFPVDGLSIQIYPAWSGGANEARYAQSVGYGTYSGGGPTVQLRDDELIYVRPNPNTASPFGTGPLEIAFNSISRQLGVAEFAGKVTSNAKPSAMIDLGEGAANELAAFRAYWTSDVEGQGVTPIVATKGGAVHKLYPDGDNALYLKYQEFLKSEIAIAFDLSPQNLGVERDVNRSTADVAQERDWDQAIVPWAALFASVFTRHAIQGRLGFYQLAFQFNGLKREDAKLDAEVFELEYKNNAVTPDEYRETRKRPPLGGQWGKMTYADMQIATNAARGAAVVDDPDLPQPPEPKPANKAPAQPKQRE